MKAENIIVTVRNELIRSVATVDEWFDSEQSLMEFQPSSGRRVCELLRHLMLTNHFLLTLIDKECNSTRRGESEEFEDLLADYCLEILSLERIGQEVEFSPWGPDVVVPTENKPLTEVRNEIRDQLNESLILLENLNQGEGTLYKIRLPLEGVENLDVYQTLYFLALYTRKQVGQLHEILEEYNKDFNAVG